MFREKNRELNEILLLLEFLSNLKTASWFFLLRVNASMK